MVLIGRKKGRSMSCLQLYSGVVTLALLLVIWEQQQIGISSSTYSLIGCLLPPDAASSDTLPSSSFQPSARPETTLIPAKQVSQKKYTSVDCRSFVKNVAVDTDPSGNEKVLVRTKTNPPFLIALHKQEHDKVRWDIVEYGRYYEWGLEDIWTGILKEAAPGSHVVDIGGNVGYYSLLSASIGSFEIHSFEPNPTNILRFCESIGVNFWGAAADDDEPAVAEGIVTQRPEINIFQLGVSNGEGNLSFFFDDSNPGAGRFVSGKEQLNADAQTKVQKVPVTTLDSFARDREWFVRKPNIEILKVDVERHEAQVLLGGKDVLKSGLVRNIFTEVGADVDREIQIEALKLLIHSGYVLKGQGNFRGPTQPSPWKHDDERLAENIMDHVDKKKASHPYINLWWALNR